MVRLLFRGLGPHQLLAARQRGRFRFPGCPVSRLQRRLGTGERPVGPVVPGTGRSDRTLELGAPGLDPPRHSLEFLDPRLGLAPAPGQGVDAFAGLLEAPVPGPDIDAHLLDAPGALPRLDLEFVASPSRLGKLLLATIMLPAQAVALLPTGGQVVESLELRCHRPGFGARRVLFAGEPLRAVGQRLGCRRRFDVESDQPGLARTCRIEVSPCVPERVMTGGFACRRRLVRTVRLFAFPPGPGPVVGDRCPGRFQLGEPRPVPDPQARGIFLVHILEIAVPAPHSTIRRSQPLPRRQQPLQRPGRRGVVNDTDLRKPRLQAPGVSDQPCKRPGPVGKGAGCRGTGSFDPAAPGSGVTRGNQRGRQIVPEYRTERHFASRLDLEFVEHRFAGQVADQHPAQCAGLRLHACDVGITRRTRRSGSLQPIARVPPGGLGTLGRVLRLVDRGLRRGDLHTCRGKFLAGCHRLPRARLPVGERPLTGSEVLFPGLRDPELAFEQVAAGIGGGDPVLQLRQAPCHGVEPAFGFVEGLGCPRQLPGSGPGGKGAFLARQPRKHAFGFLPEPGLACEVVGDLLQPGLRLGTIPCQPCALVVDAAARKFEFPGFGRRPDRCLAQRGQHRASPLAGRGLGCNQCGSVPDSCLAGQALLGLVRVLRRRRLPFQVQQGRLGIPDRLAEAAVPADLALLVPKPVEPLREPGEPICHTFEIGVRVFEPQACLTPPGPDAAQIRRLLEQQAPLVG